MGTRTAVTTVRAALEIAIKNVLDASDTASAKTSIGDTVSQVFKTGTTADKADRVFCRKALTVDEAGSPTSIDLFAFGSQNMGAGAGLDGLGQALSFVEIVAVMIKNYSTSAGNLIVGGEGTAAAWNSLFASQTSAPDDSALVIMPDGLFVICAPPDPAYVVANTTNHLLGIDSSAGVATYDIYIIGRSA